MVNLRLRLLRASPTTHCVRSGQEHSTLLKVSNIMQNDTKKVVLLKKDTYLAFINNSLDAKIFQNFYAAVDGEKKDLVKKGELSCAFFVSSTAKLFDLIQKIHITVNGTEKDLLGSGWGKIEEPRVGSIIIWGETEIGGEKHKHIGFYIGNEQAISNSCVEKVPKKHHWTFHGKSKVVNILWNDKIN
jgi:hypothetical protein